MVSRFHVQYRYIYVLHSLPPMFLHPIVIIVYLKYEINDLYM